jgi:hypothetical protein
LSNENEKLMNKLDIAEATWVWEAHLARFVVDSSKEIYEFNRFKQMNRHLTNVKAKDNFWIKIKITSENGQESIGIWSTLLERRETESHIRILSTLISLTLS